jgi:4-azaleucine resistance transporter AzlC
MPRSQGDPAVLETTAIDRREAPPQPPNVPGESRLAQVAAGARAGVPIILGALAVGVAFGVLARTAGLSVAEIALMSIILFAGSAQFIATSLIAAGAAAPAIVATVFLVNVRHLLYSAALAPQLRRLPTWKNVLIGAELTDETFAVAASHLAAGRPARASWLIGLNLSFQVCWVASTVAGALLGDAIPDTRALGLDFALGAMFTALLVIQMASRPNPRVALAVIGVGAVVGVGGALVVPGSWAVVAATVAAASVGLALEAQAKRADGEPRWK